MSDEAMKPETRLTDEERLKNLANAAQDIRTLLETPRVHDSEGRIWRCYYFLDGYLRTAILVSGAPSDGPSGFVRTRHDYGVQVPAIGGPDCQPEDIAVWLGLDNVPEGHVNWRQDKSKTHSKAGLVIPMQNPNLVLPHR